MEESWRRLYETAILETDGSKIRQRITAAELAIRARMEEITSDPAFSEERSAISGALSGLRILEAELQVGSWGDRALTGEPSCLGGETT